MKLSNGSLMVQPADDIPATGRSIKSSMVTANYLPVWLKVHKDSKAFTRWGRTLFLPRLSRYVDIVKSPSINPMCISWSQPGNGQTRWSSEIVWDMASCSNIRPVKSSQVVRNKSKQQNKKQVQFLRPLGPLFNRLLPARSRLDSVWLIGRHGDHVRYRMEPFHLYFAHLSLNFRV